jgi:hypothetical protein
MTDTLKKQIETAKRIISQKNCQGIECVRDFCPVACKGGDCTIIKEGSFADNNEKCVQWFRDWLAENDPDQKEIIEWPGNAEEMRQYIGRKVAFSNNYSGLSSASFCDTLLDVKSDHESPFITKGHQEWRYIKVLPTPEKPEVTEIPFNEAIAILAKNKGVDPSTIRIKE